MLGLKVSTQHSKCTSSQDILGKEVALRAGAHCLPRLLRRVTGDI